MAGPRSKPTTAKTVKSAIKAKPAAPKASAPAAKPAPKVDAPVTKPVAEPMMSAPAVPAAIVEPAPAPQPEPSPPAPIAEPASAPAPVEAIKKVATPIIEAAKAAVTTAAKTAAATVKKEETSMATTFEAPKFEAPKMFNDFNDKAKAAFEKGSKGLEELSEFAKGNVEALVESGKIAAKGLETMGQDAADYSRKSFESMTATLKSLSAVKSPTEFFKLHSDYMRASFDAAVAQGSKNTEAMLKLAGDAAQPIQNRMAVAADKVKSVA